MTPTRLHIVHDGPYPIFARPTPLRPAYGICAKDLAYLYRDPFVIRRSRRTWRQSLAHWWRSYRWIACLALAGCCWLLAVLEFGNLLRALQGGIW